MSEAKTDNFIMNDLFRKFSDSDYQVHIFFHSYIVALPRRYMDENLIVTCRTDIEEAWLPRNKHLKKQQFVKVSGKQQDQLKTIKVDNSSS